MGLLGAIIWAIVVFVFGLLIGSFLNVCIYRIPRHESIVVNSSHCTKCGSKIKWYDLIPVISYICLGGKCRVCKDKISMVYPTIELTNALAYLGIYLYMGRTIYSVITAILSSVLIVSVMMKIQQKKSK